MQSPAMQSPAPREGGAGGTWERVARAFGESLGYGARFMAAAACPGLEGRRVASTAMRSKTKRARSCSINASVTLATLQSGVADLVLAYRDAPSSQTNRPPSRPGGRSALGLLYGEANPNRMMSALMAPRAMMIRFST